MFLASTQAMIIYFMIHNLYGGAYTVKDNGVYAIGALSYSVCIVLISSKLQYEYPLFLWVSYFEIQFTNAMGS